MPAHQAGSELHKKGKIYIMDDTTGLHMADTEKLLASSAAGKQNKR